PGFPLSRVSRRLGSEAGSANYAGPSGRPIAGTRFIAASTTDTRRAMTTKEARNAPHIHEPERTRLRLVPARAHESAARRDPLPPPRLEVGHPRHADPGRRLLLRHGDLLHDHRPWRPWLALPASPAVRVERPQVLLDRTRQPH